MVLALQKHIRKSLVKRYGGNKTAIKNAFASEEISLRKASFWALKDGTPVPISLDQRLRDVIETLGWDEGTYDKLHRVGEINASKTWGHLEQQIATQDKLLNALVAEHNESMTKQERVELSQREKTAMEVIETHLNKQRENKNEQKNRLKSLIV
jgi:hypothetical protein